MHVVRHALIGAAIGAVAAALPDVMLLTFGWERTWVPDTDWRVAAHRWLHSPRGLLLVLTLIVCCAWASHIYIDWHTPHRTGPTL